MSNDFENSSNFSYALVLVNNSLTYSSFMIKMTNQYLISSFVIVYLFISYLINLSKISNVLNFYLVKAILNWYFTKRIFWNFPLFEKKKTTKRSKHIKTIKKFVLSI